MRRWRTTIRTASRRSATPPTSRWSPPSRRALPPSTTARTTRPPARQRRRSATTRCLGRMSRAASTRTTCASRARCPASATTSLRPPRGSTRHRRARRSASPARRRRGRRATCASTSSSLPIGWPTSSTPCRRCSLRACVCSSMRATPISSATGWATRRGRSPCRGTARPPSTRRPTTRGVLAARRRALRGRRTASPSCRSTTRATWCPWTSPRTLSRWCAPSRAASPSELSAAVGR
mmetsp:Transcript_93225/g.279677  ORF Transcript_93225/g.279677 Transcript_93225/m.279677 type:complete len:237 (+) Transcript_93225:42-752(+)